ncbi:hypothetical protein CPC16_007431 [Podila verticillata]|nr:hypothetical protein BGZ52_007702 [Haplosporangium bisporale]KAF9214896.1 hypothetical protein BGZ59_002750 [Podila verticillata]KAF9395667.1 hypothetical protein CPC16_007431 [Podila verticillata]KFH64036.1 hypothetical protein MVEG_09861 [Podila verticillata NRRL 6337]
MVVRQYSNVGKKPLLPLQQPSSSPARGSTSLSYKKTAFLLVAITSALLLVNTFSIQFSASSPTSTQTATSPSTSPPSAISQPNVNYTPENAQIHPYNEEEYDEPAPSEDDDDDERWQFADNTTNENGDGDENDESEESDESDEFVQEEEQPQSSSLSKNPNNYTAPPGVVSLHCPSLVLSTSTSFDSPSFTSASTASSSPTTPALQPDQVTCRPIPSLLKEYSLAFCISSQDCSQGFIQIVHTVPADDSVWKIKPSKNQAHTQYFRDVAGPDDFYFVIQGAQKLALGAHLVSKDLLVSVPGSEVVPKEEKTLLVYRSDFRMTLPGPVQLSGWLAYDKFRSIREDRPGIWPQWRHEALIQPETEIDAMDELPVSGPSTRFTICPACEMELFVDQVKTYRDNLFEQCDRMAPVRGAYWREDLALKLYPEQDVVNKAPGAGGIAATAAAKTDKQKFTKGWRFVPSGCTMTATPHLPTAASTNPFHPTCNSIASPASELRTPEKDSIADFPHRRILFTGDSQVRATYNAILNHYRPADPTRQKFSTHSEVLPNELTLALNRTFIGKGKPAADDTKIEMMYKADQFLDDILASTDDELDKFDTIYINLGQWPASGPVAGGQWSTAQFLERWEMVITRLNRWKASRKERAQDPTSARAAVLKDTGSSSRVIWAGQNAFPMRTDPQIRVKGDWRTNARLGYWDDWIETISQKEGGWFRRMNSWQLTFPMLDEIVDRAHYQETDAIDALKLEALYKLDLCSKMAEDQPYAT